MDVELSLKEMRRAWHGNVKSYLIGFFGSLLLTSISFLIVRFQFLGHPGIYYTLAGLALTQAALQLIYFLNLANADKPNWELFVFSFMLLIMLIIVIGSLWIMYDLDQRTMSFHKEHLVQQKAPLEHP